MKQFCLEGVADNVQYGKNGPRVKHTAGVFAMRNAADLAFARCQGADSVADDDFVTRRQLLAGGGSSPGLPGMIYSGLQFYIDASDPNSYPGSGTAVTDIKGNGSSGTVVAPTIGFEGVWQFDGLSGNINFVKNASLDNIFDEGGTVMVFCNPASGGEGGFGRLADTSVNISKGWIFFLENDDGVATGMGFIRVFGGTDGDWDTDGRPVFLNTFGSCAVRYNASNVANTPDFFGNGVVCDSNGTQPTGSPVSDAGENLYIGNRPGDDNTFDGDIAIVLAWDRELTDNEIAQVHNLFIDRLQRGGSVAAILRQTTAAANGPANIVADRGESSPTIAANTFGNYGNTNFQCETIASRGIVGPNTEFAAILSGLNNRIQTDSDYAGILSGRDSDMDDALDSVICGGFGHFINDSQQSGVGSGSSNDVAPTAGSINFSWIGGGERNKIFGGSNAGILSGEDNWIGTAAFTSTVASWSWIGGGDTNRILGLYNGIGGGFFNDMGVGAGVEPAFSWIPGGRSCVVNSDYAYAFGRRSRVLASTHDGAWITSDSTDQDDDTDRANQHKLRYAGGFTRRTTPGSTEESWERFNAHLSLSGVSASGTVVLGTLPTNTRTLDVDKLRVHGIRTNSSAGVADTFKADIEFTGRRRNDGNQAIFDQNTSTGFEGTGSGVTAVLQVTGSNYEVVVTLPGVQPTTEDWEFAIRWERQVGGQP